MTKVKGAIAVNIDHCKVCVLCVIACPQVVNALANHVIMRGYP